MSEPVAEPVVIAPTVGRKVWYRPTLHDKAGPHAMTAYGDQPLDATVLHVWSDRCVNLLIVDAKGGLFPRTSVRLLQPDDAPPVDPDGEPLGGYAEWMPYQMGQAKKVAA